MVRELTSGLGSRGLVVLCSGGHDTSYTYHNALTSSPPTCINGTELTIRATLQE